MITDKNITQLAEEFIKDNYALAFPELYSEMCSDFAKTNDVKQYWQQGMYTEEEVRELFQAIKVTQDFAKQFGLPCDIIELFEENKKKQI